MALPLLWDIVSLISILFLHFKSFSKKEETSTQCVPQAGHYSQQGGVPSIDDLTWSDSFVSNTDQRSSILNRLDNDEEVASKTNTTGS